MNLKEKNDEQEESRHYRKGTYGPHHRDEYRDFLSRNWGQAKLIQTNVNRRGPADRNLEDIASIFNNHHDFDFLFFSFAHAETY